MNKTSLRAIVAVVHAKGGALFLQVWHVGWVSNLVQLLKLYIKIYGHISNLNYMGDEKFLFIQRDFERWPMRFKS